MYAPGSQSQHWHTCLDGLGQNRNRSLYEGTRGSLGNRVREYRRGVQGHDVVRRGGRREPPQRICCSQPGQSLRVHDHRRTEQLWRIALLCSALVRADSNLDIPLNSQSSNVTVTQVKLPNSPKD
jgi:hypothetical protein